MRLTKAQRTMMERAAHFQDVEGWEGIAARGGASIAMARRLERAGLLRFACITDWINESHLGSEVRVYAITKAGRAALGKGER